jgi:DNA polymerase
MTRPETDLARELEAALAFWQAAGVTHDFTDDATAWLAQAPLAPAPAEGVRTTGTRHGAGGSAATSSDAGFLRSRAAPPAVAPQAPRPDLLGESPPADLAAFREWWMTAAGLSASRTYPRIAPRGPAGAALMVLVPQPEDTDRETLLEGPQGRLLANILAAMGIDAGAVYVAAALPSHTPMADLRTLAANGMDKVTAHHVALAAPARLLVLGTALGAMMGAKGADGLREINHESGKVPVMMSETLEAMLDSPALKARFWRRWMEWSASH